MTWSYFKLNIQHTISVQALAASLMFAMPAAADSSSPLLAAYYDDFLAICDNKVYEWSNFDTPQKSIAGVKQVGVGTHKRYALTEKGVLLVWSDDPSKTTILMDDVKSFYAGRSGLLVIRNNDSLWKVETKSLFGFGEEVSGKPLRIANGVLTASVGDSANYYVTRTGSLFVQGLAHRGQYGDGKLNSTKGYIQTSEDVVQVVSHTGHALVLKQNSDVWGTGGNIYGPLGRHGYRDKAIKWGLIIEGVRAIATGSSHSLAIKRDGSLWIWGRNEGLDPRQVMTEVTAVAAGNSSTIALSKGALWQWDTGTKPKIVMKCT
jgi:hypothetical protein